MFDQNDKGFEQNKREDKTRVNIGVAFQIWKRFLTSVRPVFGSAWHVIISGRPFLV